MTDIAAELYEPHPDVILISGYLCDLAEKIKRGDNQSYIENAPKHPISTR